MKSLFLLDAASSSLTGKEKIFYVGVLLFLATLYLPGMPVINNVTIGLLFLYSFIFNSFNEKKQLLRSRPEVVLILIFFLWHLVSALLSGNQAEGFSVAGMRSPLILFPVALGTILVQRALKDRIIYAYAFVTSLAALLCLVWAIVRLVTLHRAEELYNDNLSIAINKQSVYVAMMVNVAVFGWGYLLIRKPSFIKFRRWIYVTVIFLLLFHFLLASRVNILILYSAILGFSLYYIIKERRILEGLTLVTGLLFGIIVMVKFFPKTFNRFREMEYTQYKFDNNFAESHFNMKVTADQWNGANIRLAIWNCGWQLSKKHFFSGVPLGDKMDRLMAVYKSRDFTFGVRTRRNLHDNYLDVLVTFGIFGLLLFLTGFFVWPLLRCIKTGDFFGLFTLMALAIALISETYMDRSLGNVLLGFLVSFVISYRPPGRGEVNDYHPRIAE